MKMEGRRALFHQSGVKVHAGAIQKREISGVNTATAGNLSIRMLYRRDMLHSFQAMERWNWWHGILAVDAYSPVLLIKHAADKIVGSIVGYVDNQKDSRGRSRRI